jgi:hypothetical protein
MTDSYSTRFQLILDRLEKVKPTGHGRALARCPAHEDREPSLSLREMDDGRILLHCFSGCHAVDVLSAIGLEWPDVMPYQGHSLPPCAIPMNVRRAESAKEKRRSEQIAHEALIVLIAAQDVAKGRAHGDVDMERVRIAQQRLKKLSGEF